MHICLNQTNAPPQTLWKLLGVTPNEDRMVFKKNEKKPEGCT